ncbi:MAG: GNAT family N-acetyltransferase [Fusobacteriaceae bacterium]|jgi:GNAT superfamily N-acetyltransferase|nr:GNAT family N-acetyltransferase [Fusobacteriaceae bacterium]
MKTFVINEDTVLRFAERKDVPIIFDFIRGLAEYEHLSDQVEASEDVLEKYIFDEQKVEVLICEYKTKPVGFALYFHNFSTFLGRPGIYIEDIFVYPEYRGKGIGKAILKTIASIVVDRNYGRLEWACLDWNEPSIEFYKKQGAIPMDEWTTYRVTGDNLIKLAKN